MMNLTLMTLHWETMSSGKHSGNPSCSGDQSPAAAPRSGQGNSKEPSKDLGPQPREPLNALARWRSQTQQVPAASGLQTSSPGGCYLEEPTGAERPPFFFHFLLSTFFLLAESPKRWDRLAGEARKAGGPSAARVEGRPWASHFPEKQRVSLA